MEVTDKTSRSGEAKKEAGVAEVDTENNLSIAKPKPEPVAEAVTAEVEAQETVAVEA